MLVRRGEKVAFYAEVTEDLSILERFYRQILKTNDFF